MTHLTAYRVAGPNTEFRAAAEVERAGISYDLPTETITRQARGRKPSVRSVPLIRGYICAERKPHDAKYIRGAVGRVSRDELIRCVTTMDRRQQRAADVPCPYSVGQSVLKGEVPGKVIEIRGRTCIIETTMLGKPHTQAIPYAQLRPG